MPDRLAVEKYQHIQFMFFSVWVLCTFAQGVFFGVYAFLHVLHVNLNSAKIIFFASLGLFFNYKEARGPRTL